jgi:hypothetical protein
MTLSTVESRPKKWTSSMERKMCQMWEGHEMLYDVSHEHYRDSDKRKEALEEMAAFFEVSG